jgi:hypothetical protein
LATKENGKHCEQDILRALHWRLNVPNYLTFAYAILETLNLNQALHITLLRTTIEYIKLLVIENVTSAGFYPSVLVTYVIHEAITNLVGTPVDLNNFKTL